MEDTGTEESANKRERNRKSIKFIYISLFQKELNDASFCLELFEYYQE